MYNNMEIMTSGGSTKEECAKELKEALKRKYEGKYHFEYKLVDGLNGTKIDNLIASDASGREVFPIPVDDAYECLMFKGFDEVFEIICHHIEQREFFYASENMRKALVEVVHPWFINKELNREMLQNVPHAERGDYAIVFRLCPSFSNFQLNYGILSWEDMEKYSLDYRWFYDSAIDNVQNESLYKVIRLDNGYLDDVDDFSYKDGNKCSEYIVQGLTEYCTNGSLFCKNLWEKIGKMIGENYYISFKCA